MFTTELQYSIVRYMHNDLADEAANVGLIAAADDPPRIVCRFLEDPSLKSRLDAKIKKDVVDRFKRLVDAELTTIGNSTSDNDQLSKRLFDRLNNCNGNLVRATAPRSVLTNDIDAEVEILFHQWVEPLSANTEKQIRAARDPFARMRKDAAIAIAKAFRKGLGHRLDRETFPRNYELRGATHTNRFDLAVVGVTRKKRHEHIFHHVLVLPDAEESYNQAAALCWRWTDVLERNPSDRQLTAVAYSRGGITSRGMTEASRLFRHEDIGFAHLTELPSLVKKLETQGQLFH